MTCRPSRRTRRTALGKPMEQPDLSRADDRGRSTRPALVAVQGRRTGRRCSRSSATRCSRCCATLGGDGSTYSHHMRDARFTIPTPDLLAKVVDMLDDIPMGDRDTKGDLYEYMLSKIATAGQNGQFRTPRHIIQLMVEMMAPGPTDEICDPACGTAGFLVAAGEYVRAHAHGSAAGRDAAASTSTTACSTASTSTARCCASAA